MSLVIQYGAAKLMKEKDQDTGNIIKYFYQLLYIVGSIDPTGHSTTYYYGANRYHARYPWPERKIEEEVQLMSEISEEGRPTVRQRLSRESGYTGLSILHRLNKLYGFDVLKDTVFDVMHNIPLNVVGSLLKELIASGKLDAC